MAHQMNYTEDAAQHILRRALERQAQEGAPAPHVPPAVSEQQLARMAQELSICPQALTSAKRDWGRAQALSSRRKALLRGASAFVGYNGLVYLLGGQSSFYVLHPDAAYIPMLWGLGLLAQVARMWWPGHLTAQALSEPVPQQCCALHAARSRDVERIVRGRSSDTKE